jgi:hypothetical protein
MAVDEPWLLPFFHPCAPIPTAAQIITLCYSWRTQILLVILYLSYFYCVYCPAIPLAYVHSLTLVRYIHSNLELKLLYMPHVALNMLSSYQ